MLEGQQQSGAGIDDALLRREGAEAHLAGRGADLRMGLAAAALGAPVLIGALIIPGLMSGELTDAVSLGLRFGAGVAISLTLVAVFSQVLTRRSAPELLTTVRDGGEVSGRVVGRHTTGAALVEGSDGQRWLAEGEAEAPEGAIATVWTHGEHTAIALAGGVWPGRRP